MPRQRLSRAVSHRLSGLVLNDELREAIIKPRAGAPVQERSQKGRRDAM